MVTTRRILAIVLTVFVGFGVWGIFGYRTNETAANQADLCRSQNDTNEVIRAILNKSNEFVQTSRVRTPQEKQLTNQYYQALLALVPPNKNC